MAKFVFGKSIDYIFVPTIDGEPVKVYGLSGAYIYADEPTSAQIDAGSGALETVATWTDEGDYAKKIAFAAVTDADEHSAEEYETYWVVTKFRYQAAGAVKWSKESIYVFRPDALTSRITTNYVDVFGLEPKLEDHYAPGDVERFLARAKKDIFRKYRGQGYERKRLFNLEELNDACLFRATALACLSLYGENSQHWKDKFDVRDEQFRDVFAETKVGYDIVGTGAPAPTETAGGGYTATWIR